MCGAYRGVSVLCVRVLCVGSGVCVCVGVGGWVGACVYIRHACPQTYQVKILLCKLFHLFLLRSQCTVEVVDPLGQL